MVWRVDPRRLHMISTGPYLGSLANISTNLSQASVNNGSRPRTGLAKFLSENNPASRFKGYGYYEGEPISNFNRKFFVIAIV